MTGTTHTRGEVTFTLDGKEYTVLPNVKAILAIEQATGKPILQVGIDAMSLGITVNSAVLFHALRANGIKDVTFDEVAEGLMNDIGTKEQELFKASSRSSTASSRRLSAPRKVEERVGHWADAYAEFAMGVLHWTPDAFYAATLHDLHRALTGWKRVNGIKDEPRKLASPPPMSRTSASG